MKQIVIFLSILVLAGPGLDAQKQTKYYKVDSIKTIRGKITDITFEKDRFKKEFTVMYVKEKKNGDIYRVEVSPAWFFNMDLAKGSRIEVAGSYSREQNRHTIMTRSINFQGEKAGQAGIPGAGQPANVNIRYGEIAEQ